MATNRAKPSANGRLDGALDGTTDVPSNINWKSESSDSLNRKVFSETTTVSEPNAIIRIIRLLSLATYFWSCCSVIGTTQYIGMPLYILHRESYYRFMAHTKRAMGLFVFSMTQWWTTTRVYISGDESVQGRIRQLPDGRVELGFAERMVLISNHQLYNDWVYLWQTAYLNSPQQHGDIFIVLKQSISYIPLIGLGLRLAGFVFMARKMQTDKARLQRRMSQLSRRSEKDGRLNPMWLVMFPEGTNLSKNGRAASSKWAQKQGVKDYEHVLIPRSAGTYFCLKALEGNVEWIYDCTLAYDGVPEGKYGQDIFTLRSTYFDGHPPPVHLHWRRYQLSKIPMATLEVFDAWLHERWNEKEALLEHHAKTGRFPSDEKPIVTEVKLNSWAELFWALYGVPLSVCAGIAAVLWAGGWMGRS